jgi:hypothetical protein
MHVCETGAADRARGLACLAGHALTAVMRPLAANRGTAHIAVLPGSWYWLVLGPLQDT